MSKVTSGDPRAAQGRKRQHELAEEMKAQIQVNVASLISGLGREATALEAMQAEMIASLYLRARRLRDNGRSDVALLKQAALLMRDSAFRSPHAVAPATERKPD
jgi:hypothetical protein